MNGPVLIPICSWFLTALSDFFNSLLAAGVFGAPSYVLPSGEIFWGQDRLELLDRTLKQLA
jgi:2-hydroxychromene-2-carboxylate isomerase